MNIYIRSFIKIRKWLYLGEKCSGGNFTGREEKFRGGIFEKKKMNTYKIGLQNKRIYEISSKSNNGRVIKYTGKIFWGGISQDGGEI